jgi:hypothetical protein
MTNSTQRLGAVVGAVLAGATLLGLPADAGAADGDEPIPYPCTLGVNFDWCARFEGGATGGGPGDRPAVAPEDEQRADPCTRVGADHDWCARFGDDTTGGGAGERPTVAPFDHHPPVLPCTTGGALEWCSSLDWPAADEASGGSGRRPAVWPRANVIPPHPCATGAADPDWCEEQFGYDPTASGAGDDDSSDFVVPGPVHASPY